MIILSGVSRHLSPVWLQESLTVPITDDLYKKRAFRCLT